MNFEISGLLFDNDGTLVDSHAAVKAAWAQWCLEFSSSIDLDAPGVAGRRAEDLVRERVSPEAFERANDRINELEQESAFLTVALPGSWELLYSLPAERWTVCTSANANLGRARLAAAGLPIPAALVTAADVKAGKPNPDPYLLGANRLGYAASECAVFEDALAGVEAGKAAGAALVIGVSERALDTPADLVVRDLTGIRFHGNQLEIPDANRLR